MSEADKPPKPRRTPLVLWLLLATFGLAALLIGLSLFGPNPRIVVGKDTTRITAPLLDDGLPDYAAAWVAASRLDEDGRPITPERNGAIPFLRAMWLDDDESPTPEQLEALCVELGVEYPPAGPRFERIYSDTTKAGVRRFLEERYAAPAGGDPAIERRQQAAWQRSFEIGGPVFDVIEQELDEAAVGSVLDACQPVTRPWTAEDLPFLAAWCDRNEGAFDLLREACEADAWRLPSASLFGAGRGSLIFALLSFVQEARTAARALNTRAMRHLGEGRADEAARDAESLLRLGDHLRSGPTLVEQLVAAAIEGIGRSVVRDVCHDGRASPERLRSIAAFLGGVDSEAAFLRSIDIGERYFGLDVALATASGESLSSIDSGFSSLDPVLSAARIDWNVVLRSHNAYFDSLLAAAKTPGWAARRDRLEALEAETANLLATTPSRLATAVFSARSRGKAIADVWVQLLGPAIAAVFQCEDRMASNRQLTRVAIALELARRETGAYPDTLDAMHLPKRPDDRLRGAPLVYRRTDDGYLLYSLGANGRDDGGSNEGSGWGAATLEGEELDDWTDAEGDEEPVDDPASQIPNGADDISLRMPPAVAPWPWEIGVAD